MNTYDALMEAKSALTTEEYTAIVELLASKDSRVAVLEKELELIRAQAEDATEYVLAQINRELRGQNLKARSAAYKLRTMLARGECQPRSEVDELIREFCG